MKDKLPEFTGDKLTAWGDEFHLSWGTRLGSPGEVLDCGEVIPLNVGVCRRGTIFRPRLSGMLVKNMYCCWGMLGSAGAYPISLRFINSAWRRMHLLSGELRCTDHVL